MKLVVGSKTNLVYASLLDDEDTTIKGNRIGIHTFEPSIPDDAIIVENVNEKHVYPDGESIDESYQKFSISITYAAGSNSIVYNHTIVEWRTQAEAEAEAAASALDVTPDSA